MWGHQTGANCEWVDYRYPPRHFREGRKKALKIESEIISPLEKKNRKEGYHFIFFPKRSVSNDLELEAHFFSLIMLYCY